MYVEMSVAKFVDMMNTVSPGWEIEHANIGVLLCYIESAAVYPEETKQHLMKALDALHAEKERLNVWKDIESLRTTSLRNGYYSFDQKLMRSMRIRVYPKIYYGKYFIRRITRNFLPSYEIIRAHYTGLCEVVQSELPTYKEAKNFLGCLKLDK